MAPLMENLIPIPIPAPCHPCSLSMVCPALAATIGQHLLVHVEGLECWVCPSFYSTGLMIDPHHQMNLAYQSFQGLE